MIGINLAKFQKNCAEYMVNSTILNNKPLVIKSPTGSGKTIITISFVEEYLAKYPNSIFIWLCPGNGDLEEQSKRSMEQNAPYLKTKTLQSGLTSGFYKGDTIFINWELVTKKGNKSLTDTERHNLFDRIKKAHQNGYEFIVIIDEEHSHDTVKAQYIIDSFSPKKVLRMSATAKKRQDSDWYEISESEVIKEQFISKAIVINQGIKDYNITDENEKEVLINLALQKRQEIHNEYKRLGININPLIIIQFPSSSDSLIKSVEDYLNEKGINYDNCLLAKWMADEKDKINLGFDPDWDISDNEAFPIVLLMKQAISTGWNCLRAKVLVKLRENMADDFEIQTIGRIRRMPERKHYNIDLLDYCYLFTLDTNYVEHVKETTKTLFEIKRIKLKEEFKNIELIKQMKNDNSEVDIRKACKTVTNYFKSNYELVNNKQSNKKLLSDSGYIISDKIINSVKYGDFVTLSEIKEDDIKETELNFEVNTHKHGMDLNNAVFHIGNSCGISAENTKIILKRLFSNDVIYLDKLLSLSRKEYYAFVINNESKLIEDFHNATLQLIVKCLLTSEPNEKKISFPEEELIKYDSSERAEEELTKNVYENYTEQTLVDGIRSKCERLFERYCETRNIKGIYKNGDAGLQYLSIVYYDALRRQFLFYPDYVVLLNDDSILLVETKGGELNDGTSKNIDDKIELKFAGLKEYAQNHNCKWAFVRDKNDKLYFDNTDYIDSMDDIEKWKPIKELF